MSPITALHGLLGLTMIGGRLTQAIRGQETRLVMSTKSHWLSCMNQLDSRYVMMDRLNTVSRKSLFTFPTMTKPCTPHVNWQMGSGRARWGLKRRSRHNAPENLAGGDYGHLWKFMKRKRDTSENITFFFLFPLGRRAYVAEAAKKSTRN